MIIVDYTPDIIYPRYQDDAFVVGTKKKLKTREFSIHDNLYTRCYNPKYQEKKPTYIGCYMHEYVKDFQMFAHWLNLQPHFNSVDDSGKFYNLDKDLIEKGNKCYAFDKMVLVPITINSFLTKANSKRNGLPLGVHYHKSSIGGKSPYQVGCRNPFLNKDVYLAAVSSPEQGFEIYKKYKESMAVKLAEHWKGRVDEIVIQSLLNYRVEITD